MGKSKDLATLKDSGLSIDGTLTTTSTGTNLTSNSYNVVKIQTDKDDNGSNDDAILQFTTGSSNTVKGELRYDESESMFEIGHGDNQGHIRIDNAGRVTKPNQVGFFARRTSHVTSSGDIIFTDVEFNRGSHYNASNGRFTAPVDGVYLFTFACLLYNMNSSSLVTLNVNGSAYGGMSSFGTYGTFTGTYAGQSASAVAELNANDYVTIYFSRNTTNLHANYIWVVWFHLG